MFEHGIGQENSDIRAHVSPLKMQIFVFKTSSILELLKKESFPEKTASQPGVVGITAKGRIIPISKIPNLIMVEWNFPPRWKCFSDTDSTSKKGNDAVGIVTDALRRGMFPLYALAVEIKDKNMQISGTDIIVSGRWKIQVKCDYPAGRTGNLFIQTHERNPKKMF